MTYKTVGKKFLKFFPGLELKIRHAEMKETAEMYLGRAIVSATFFSLLVLCALIATLIISANKALYPFLAIMPLCSFAILMFYELARPSLIISKRNTDIERNLLFALRHLLVEIRSGISLYESLISIANANYGALSDEFKKVTKMISMGVPENKALEEVMIKNPSVSFRRAMWQVTNAMQAGYDIGDVLEELVKEFAAEQRTAIRMYGSQLNSLALVYMIFAIIAPSIGLCFLIILSFFSGFPINQGILIFLMIIVCMFQFTFIGIVKSKRPKVE
jgi:archaeal flagellar protein FlaJ